ncbi:MAG: hypothetical protein AB7F43_04830 [Bacteriovoracia bacterium]
MNRIRILFLTGLFVSFFGLASTEFRGDSKKVNEILKTCSDFVNEDPQYAELIRVIEKTNLNSYFFDKKTFHTTKKLEPLSMQPLLPTEHYAWQVSYEELIRHIVFGHLRSFGALQLTGVACYDIDLGAYRGFDLSPLVSEIVSLLSENDQVVDLKINEVNEKNYPNRFFTDVKGYRVFLVKTLIYLEQKGTVVPWEVVYDLFPMAQEVTLEIKRDCFDVEFDSNESTSLALARSFQMQLDLQNIKTKASLGGQNKSVGQKTDRQ